MSIFDRTVLDPETFCLLWTGAIKDNGYGSVHRGGIWRSAHRAAWEATRGPIPEGAVVCHRCDVRRCINPSHLFLGSHADNSRDMVLKGRYRGPRKIDGKARQRVRAAVDSGESQRVVAARWGISQATVSNIVRKVHP